MRESIVHTSTTQTEPEKKMNTMNYRHSLKTMNKSVAAKGYKIGFFMQSGKPTYQVSENGQVCGFYYRATDVAEFCNKVNSK